MAPTPELNVFRCIEWTTKKLSGIKPWFSPNFKFQGKQCHLMLYRKLPSPALIIKENYRDYCTYFLYICGKQRLSLPFKVAVSIDHLQFENPILFPYNTIKDQSDSIWECSAAELSVICKMKCDMINYLRFRIKFYEEDYETDVKSVQTPLYIDARFQLEGISNDFSSLLDKGPNYDVEFTCDDLTIKAHKSVLCCRSKVFASMLGTDMMEGKTGQVKIQDMNGIIFKEFLRCLYTGMLPELTADIAVQFYEASDKYDVDALKKQCSSFLAENLTPNDAYEILVIADRHNDSGLKKVVTEYMMTEKMPLQGKKWPDFCKKNPTLSNEVLNLFCWHLAENHP